MQAMLYRPLHLHLTLIVARLVALGLGKGYGPLSTAVRVALNESISCVYLQLRLELLWRFLAFCIFCFAISFPCSQGARVTGTLAYALEGIYLEIPIDAAKMTRHQFRAVLISIDF